MHAFRLHNCTSYILSLTNSSINWEVTASNDYSSIDLSLKQCFNHKQKQNCILFLDVASHRKLLICLLFVCLRITMIFQLFQNSTAPLWKTRMLKRKIVGKLIVFMTFPLQLRIIYGWLLNKNLMSLDPRNISITWKHNSPKIAHFQFKKWFLKNISTDGFESVVIICWWCSFNN